MVSKYNGVSKKKVKREKCVNKDIQNIVFSVDFDKHNEGQTGQKWSSANNKNILDNILVSNINLTLWETEI